MTDLEYEKMRKERPCDYAWLTINLLINGAEDSLRRHMCRIKLSAVVMSLTFSAFFWRHQLDVLGWLLIAIFTLATWTFVACFENLSYIRSDIESYHSDKRGIEVTRQMTECYNPWFDEDVNMTEYCYRLRVGKDGKPRVVTRGETILEREYCRHEYFD